MLIFLDGGTSILGLNCDSVHCVFSEYPISLVRFGINMPIREGGIPVEFRNDLVQYISETVMGTQLTIWRR